ncbi:MAG: hypothetical protein LUF04_11320 [Bacteroides sp.]|nr:hypothetical protein [Bacteroides sp.]
MTHPEGIERCRQCVSRDFVNGMGMVCKLTRTTPQLEDPCEHFAQDEELAKVAPLSQQEEETYTVEELLREENLPMGLLAGWVAALSGAAVWAAVSVATGYQIGYMAVGMGLLVGFMIRRFGKGVRPVFGVMGALLALLGCILGDVFSFIGFIATEMEASFTEVAAQVDYGILAELLFENLLSITALFYAIAVYEGYKFSFRVRIERESGKI